MEFYKEIKQILDEEIGDDIAEASQEVLLELKDSIQKYLLEIQRWNQLARSRLTPISYENEDERQMIQEALLKDKSRILKDILSDAELLLKEGYRIIDEIRTKITGETIKYAIGVEYRGKLYEGYISIDQLLKNTHIEFESGGSLDSLVKLRLNRAKGKMISEIGQVSPIAFQNDHSSLYTSIRAYTERYKGVITNRGNVYETYKVLVQRYGSNRIPPARFDELEFIHAYLAVRKNTDSFVQGGDILDEQVKFLGSPPSLVTIITIKNALTDFSNVISTLNPSQIREGIQRIFYKNEETDKAAQVSEQEVDKFVQKLIEYEFKKK